MKGILVTLFLIRIFTPCVGLTKESMEELQEIPEYAEYLSKMGYPKKNTTQPRISASSPNFATFPFENLPTLCNETPRDIYGHVFCWGLICLYIMLIASLIIYQLRSIFWLKTYKNNNVQHPDNNNIEVKPTNQPPIPRMLPV